MLPARVSRYSPAWPRKVTRMAAMVSEAARYHVRPHKPESGGGSMAGDVSFDVVSDFDEQELRNALDQVRREAMQRYDLKNAHIDIEHGKGELVVTSDAG